jgi:replicative DNA helicase
MNAESQRVTGAEEYRSLPYDIEIEQALLGAIQIDNKALDRVRRELTADHFYDPLHGRIYDVMHRQSDNGMTITPLTLNAALKSDPGLIEVGGHAYLAGLAGAAPAMPNVRDYAHILRDLAAIRRKFRLRLASTIRAPANLRRLGFSSSAPIRHGAASFLPATAKRIPNSTDSPAL